MSYITLPYPFYLTQEESKVIFGAKPPKHPKGCTCKACKAKGC